MTRLRSINNLYVRTFATAVSKPPLSGLNSIVRPKAEQLSSQWKGTSASGGTIKNYIGGQFLESKASVWHDIVDPVGFHSL
jgi:malonate-semialdehyde dehydrogenase (acetylating)/methylmalonate-semialdehyde dehydrogenase